MIFVLSCTTFHAVLKFMSRLILNVLNLYMLGNGCNWELRKDATPPNIFRILWGVGCGGSLYMQKRVEYKFRTLGLNNSHNNQSNWRSFPKDVLLPLNLINVGGESDFRSLKSCLHVGMHIQFLFPFPVLLSLTVFSSSSA